MLPKIEVLVATLLLFYINSFISNKVFFIRVCSTTFILNYSFNPTKVVVKVLSQKIENKYVTLRQPGV